MELKDNSIAASPRLADARSMFAVHSVFRREFGLMSQLVRNVADRDHVRARRVAAHVDLVSAFLHVHHFGEDMHIWPLLRDRGGETIEPIVERMEDQHGTIAACLGDVNDAVALWRESASAHARDTLANAITRLLPLINTHLADEETHVVPLIEKFVTETEYAVVAQEGAAHVPGDKLPIVFGMLMYETPPAVVDKIVAELPPDVRPFIRDISRRAYAAYARELYGTPTPLLAM